MVEMIIADKEGLDTNHRRNGLDILDLNGLLEWNLIRRNSHPFFRSELKVGPIIEDMTGFKYGGEEGTKLVSEASWRIFEYIAFNNGFFHKGNDETSRCDTYFAFGQNQSLISCYSYFDQSSIDDRTRYYNTEIVVSSFNFPTCPIIGKFESLILDTCKDFENKSF